MSIHSALKNPSKSIAVLPEIYFFHVHCMYVVDFPAFFNNLEQATDILHVIW